MQLGKAARPVNGLGLATLCGSGCCRIIRPANARNLQDSLSKTDRAPCEDCCKTRDREKPREDGGAGSSNAYVGNRAPHQQKDDSVKGTASFVDVGESPGSEALLGHGEKRPRAGVYTAQADGQD